MLKINLKNKLIFTIMIFIVSGSVHASLKNYMTWDPGQAHFIYKDLYTFVRAFELMKSESNKVKIIQTEYLDKGTPGLKMFVEKYGLTAEKIVKAISLHPKEYTAIEKTAELIKKKEPFFRKAMAEMKMIIPNTLFLPTYYVVSDYKGIGSGSAEGQLISIEKWKDPIEEKVTMLIHEMVHIQQVIAVGYDKYLKLFNPEKNLLGLCIREGTAEFFADLVTGKITQDQALNYTLENKISLFEKFKTEMNGRETGDWMWKKPADLKQPPHIGYVMGYLIVRSFYENAKNKNNVIRDILSVTDFQAFFKQTEYSNTK